MSTGTAGSLIRFEDLRPGDHIQVTQRVKVGLKIWYHTVRGTVVRTERRREGLHVDRNSDDFVFQDLILLRTDAVPPTETTVSMDEYARIERI